MTNVGIEDGTPCSQMRLRTKKNMKPPTVISDYMRRLQKRGVAARLKATTPEQRTEQASNAAKARWAKKRDEPKPDEPVSASQAKAKGKT